MFANNKIINVTFYALCVLIFAFFYYVLFIDCMEILPVWESFPDSSDYITQSKAELFSFDFFAPKPRQWFAPRPFTLPLFLKLVDGDPYKMVLFQKVLYFISVVFISLTFIKFFQSKISKILHLCVLVFFFLWWNIVGWSYTILSESLSMTFLFAWLGTLFLYYKNQSTLNLVLIIFVSVLFSFTRDTWPYIILLFSILNFIVFIKKREEKVRVKNSILVLFSVILFFVQDYTANQGERYKLPLFNSIVGRVVKKSEYLDWFKSKGMPTPLKIVEDFKPIENVDDDALRGVVYSKYFDSTYTPLFNWIVKDGKKTFQNFLLSHPSYLLMKDESPEKISRILCSPYFGYIRESTNFHKKVDLVFPCFSFLFAILVIGIVSFLFFKTGNRIYVLILVLSILTTANAILSYSADTLEVKRHLFITQILLNFICIVSLGLIVDYLVNHIKNVFHFSRKGVNQI